MDIYILRGFLRPWKKHCDVFSEGNAAYPFGCDSPLQLVMAVFLNLLGRAWKPADSNGRLVHFTFEK